MTQSWFDKTHIAGNELQNAADRLYSLACHCRKVGLGMADELFALVHKIDDAENDLRVAIAQGIDEECQAARAAVLNIGPACLEAIKKEEGQE